MEQKNDFKKKFLNKNIEVLVEKINSDNKIMGRSEYYFEVFFDEEDIIGVKPKLKNIVGEIVKIRYY